MLFRRHTNQNVKRNISKFYHLGFHGDTYLMKFIEYLIIDCKYFIETGTNVGSTIAFIAKTYPFLKCLSCEPDRQAFNEALNNTLSCKNVSIYNKTSQEFLKQLEIEKPEIFESNVLIWLDAHGYGFDWPLRDEISFITSRFKKCFIFIDDFKVPDVDIFKFDEYNGQICSFDFIKEAINKSREISLYYPSYTEKTSEHHPLIGWCLIEYGHGRDIEIPLELKDKVRKAL